MADGDGQCIGLVARRRVGQPQQPLHHLHHLRLLGAAVAGHRDLDLLGRVLARAKPRARTRRERDAARVPEHERGARIPRAEHRLERRDLGPERRDRARELALQMRQPLAERLTPRADRSAADAAQRAALDRDDAVARRIGARVYPQYPHSTPQSERPGRVYRRRAPTQRPQAGRRRRRRAARRSRAKSGWRGFAAPGPAKTWRSCPLRRSRSSRRPRRRPRARRGPRRASASAGPAGRPA